VRDIPKARGPLPPPFPFAMELSEVSIVECRDAVWEGSPAEERREEARRAGCISSSGFGDCIRVFIGREVNMAWGPVDLQVEYIMLIVSTELFG